MKCRGVILRIFTRGYLAKPGHPLIYYGFGLATAVSCRWNCSAPKVAVASSPLEIPRFPELELVLLELFPSPPLIQANTASVRMTIIRRILMVYLIMVMTGA
jgi:hypothetical protein